MGLSSSQARLLHLTGRMHQIEYKAAKLEAQKLQMANESAQVYNEYENALEKTKIQRSTLNTDGSLNYVDATYNALLKDGYRLGKCEYMAVSQDDIDTFNNVADKSPAEFAAIKSGYAVKNGNDITLAKDPSIHLAYTAEQLKAYTTAGNNIILMDDINVTESMGTLTSSLNGNGHTITVSGGDAIFDKITNGSVQNINIDANIINKKNDSIGALARYAYGNVSLDNIVVSGDIDAYTYGSQGNTDCGGLIGSVGNDTDDTVININNVTTNVSVKGKSDIGGVLGCLATKVTLNMENVTGNVNSTSTIHSGGLIGQSYATTAPITISNCNVNANISANNGAGGILGFTWQKANISNCYVTGTIKSTYSDEYKYSPSAGGIAGKIFSGGELSNCYSDADVSVINSAQNDCGDIVGYTDNVTINNCASKNGTGAVQICKNHGPNFTLNEAGSSNAVKSLVSSVGNRGSLTQTYTPSDDITVNGKTAGTVGADYDHYLEIGQAIADNKYFLVDGHENDTEWLTNLVNSGFVTIQKKDKDGAFYDTSVATDTHLQEVADETGLRKAEAKYEADMKRIDNKDKKFDTDLAALDNERNAIKEEMETLKTVAKDNVERTFRLFS